MDSVRTLVAVWLALLALLALSVASAWVELGVGNVLANIGIAAVKAVLVAWFFMHLQRDTALLRLASVLGLVWLLFLIGLTLADSLTRPENGVEPIFRGRTNFSPAGLSSQNPGEKLVRPHFTT